MNIFADTSGLYALLVKNDYMYVRARENFNVFAENNAQLVTSSFVLVETTFWQAKSVIPTRRFSLSKSSPASNLMKRQSTKPNMKLK